MLVITNVKKSSGDIIRFTASIFESSKYPELSVTIAIDSRFANDSEKFTHRGILYVFAVTTKYIVCSVDKKVGFNIIEINAIKS